MGTLGVNLKCTDTVCLELNKKVLYLSKLQLYHIVKKRNEKSYQVQAFCEERGLTPLLGVIW